MNVGSVTAVVDVVLVSHVADVLEAAAVPPRQRVPELVISRVPLAPGPVTPVSKFSTPAVIVSDPFVANVGVAPAFTTVAAELMVRL